jgi:hypothetical protein
MLDIDEKGMQACVYVGKKRFKQGKMCLSVDCVIVMMEYSGNVKSILLREI